MRYLGIDYGTKRVGTALSDGTGLIARTYELLANDDTLIDKIIDIISHEKVGEIVLGFPKNMNNTVGEKAESVLVLQEALKERISLPIHLQDERRSTVSAEGILIAGNMRREKRKTKIDNLAATIILQTYLDACQKK